VSDASGFATALAVGDPIFRVVETDNGPELLQRTVKRVTPRNFELDKNFGFGASWSKLHDKNSLGRAYHTTAAGALDHYRKQALHEISSAKEMLARGERRKAWAEAQFAAIGQTPTLTLGDLP